MNPSPAAHSSSLSSSPSGGADQAPTTDALVSLNVNAAHSSNNTSPSRPVIGEAGWLHFLRESWNEPWSLRFSIAYFTSDPPTPPIAAGTVDGDAHAQDQGPRFTFVLALLPFGGGAMAAVLTESKDTISGWKTVPKVLYGVTAVLAIASLAIGFMAAGCHAAVSVAGNGANLRASAFCAKLGAILSTVLLVVVISCKLGRWGCATAVPSAAVVAAIMAVVWICGDERAAARAVRNCWRRIKDLCPRCLLRTPSTRDSVLPNAGREEGDGIV